MAVQNKYILTATPGIEQREVLLILHMAREEPQL